MNIGTLIPTLNIPLAVIGGACFLGGLFLRQHFFSMIGASVVLIGLAGGYYVPGIIGGITLQLVGAAAELTFGRSGRWASALLGNLGCIVVAGSTLGSTFALGLH
jgi:hypothetical protein